MARPPSEGLTEREAQIMDVVWRLGEATAEQVREGLPDDPHDSSVRTLLRVLVTKGYLQHETRGKAYVYRAAVERRKAQKQALQGLLGRLFAGSAEDLVLRLLEEEYLTPDQLEELKQANANHVKTSRNKKGGAR